MNLRANVSFYNWPIFYILTKEKKNVKAELPDPVNACVLCIELHFGVLVLVSLAIYRLCIGFRLSLLEGDYFHFTFDHFWSKQLGLEPKIKPSDQVELVQIAVIH